MDLVKLVEMLKGASPWLVLVGGLLAGFWLYLDYRRKSKERTDLDELRDIVVDIHNECEEAGKVLAAHVASSDTSIGVFNSVVEQQTQLLQSINNELASMNAIATGRDLPNHVAKAAVESHWKVCRDETIRLLLNSIENNHFAGNEKVVARKVTRAWRQAADRSKAYVGNHPGMAYPYKPLFENHIKHIWQHAWGWALPIYYGDTVSKPDSMEDLAARMRSMFDDMIVNYFKLIEDIDRGTLYASEAAGESSGYRGAQSEALISVDGDEHRTFEDDLFSKVASYKAGEGSGSYNTQLAKEAVEKEYERDSLAHTPPPATRNHKRRAGDT